MTALDDLLGKVRGEHANGTASADGRGDESGGYAEAGAVCSDDGPEANGGAAADDGGDPGRDGPDTGGGGAAPEDADGPFLSLAAIEERLAKGPDDREPEALSIWLTPIIAGLAQHDPVVIDGYFSKIKKQFGVSKGVLVKMLNTARRRAAAVSGFTRADHVELAEHALEDLRRGSCEVVVYSEGNLYRFSPESGLWEPLDEDEQSRVIVGYAAAHSISIAATDMTGALKIAHRIAGRRQFFAHAPKGVAFKNGFVSYQGGKIEFTNLVPDHRARVALPFAYRPNGRARRWHKFLRQCFKGDPDIKGKIRLMQEFAGACLLGVATNFGKVLVLLGRGANGKSVFLSVLSALFPSAARSSIPPQKFDSDYHLARLAGVLINIVGELPEGELLQSEIFKAVVTGLDEVTARQIYKEPIHFTPKAGHVFAANKLPGTADQTHGFWRRLLVIEWPRIFTENEQDKHLSERLIATEMPGIAAWVVKGSARVLARGRYEIPESVNKAVETWRQGADPVAIFKAECTVPATGDTTKAKDGVSALHNWTKSSTLYNLFKIWAETNGFKNLSIKTFGDRLSALDVAKEKKQDGSYYKVTPLVDVVCHICGGFRQKGIEHTC